LATVHRVPDSHAARRVRDDTVLGAGSELSRLHEINLSKTLRWSFAPKVPCFVSLVAGPS